MQDKRYTEDDLREAFKAGWKERNRSPGLKRVRRQTMMSLIGGGRYEECDYVPDDRKYQHGYWQNSAFRKGLGDAG